MNNADTIRELDQLSNASSYQTNLMPVYDEIVLDGNYGLYKKRLKTQPKVSLIEDGIEKEKFVVKELGKKIDFVWLKVRRQLVETTKEGLVRQTNEHDFKDEEVLVRHFNGQADEKMIARDINGRDGKYPNMKVRQIIYALDLEEDKILRIISKGMSNSMQDKPEDACLFFDYIFNLGDDRFYSMKNVMESKPINTKIGPKFYSNFSRGKKLDQKQYSKVIEKMKELDNLLNKAKVAPAQITTNKLEDLDYGDGEVNLDAVPF